MNTPASAPIAPAVSHSIPWVPGDASWLSILQACIPVVIAAMVAWVGWRQLATAKAKLNLDLFERRMEVFNAVVDAIRHGSAQRSVPDSEMRDLLSLAPKAQFLFCQPIYAYIQEIAQKNFELTRLLVERHKAGNIMNSTEHQAVMTSQMWFAVQMVESVKLFQPYLSFAEWR